MKRLPYGISNFAKLMEENYYYVDKTRYIEFLESMGSQYIFFLRPRRFGKSLFLSMLEYYYDKNHKDKFQNLFKDTYIGQNPTKLQGSYAVLKLNFSEVRSNGTLNQIQGSFNLNIKSAIRSFYVKYSEMTGGLEQFKEDLHNINDATDLISEFISLMSTKHIDYYLLIDEYDNFANNILIEHGKDRYQKVTHAGGFCVPSLQSSKTAPKTVL